MRHGLDDTEESLSERLARHDELERVIPDNMRAKIAESLRSGRHAQARAYAKVLKAALAQKGEIVTIDELLAEIGGTGTRDNESETTPDATPEERHELPSREPKPHWWNDPRWIITTLIAAASLIIGIVGLLAL
jgi:hypothetical protein